MAIATVLYPTFSEYASRRDYVALGKSVHSGLRKVAFITFPAATGLIILRTPIIRLLFERGEFDARATYITAAALLWYALGMFFHGSNQVLIRSFHSMQDTVRPLQIISISVLVNVVCAITLVRPLGHVGLAMANSIGALSGFLLFITVLKTRIHLGSLHAILRTVGRVAVSTTMMGVTAHLTYQWTHAMAGGKLGGLFEVGSAIAVGGLVYGFALWVMGVEEMRSLLSLARRRLGLAGR